MSHILTTTEVARICGVTPGTVARWFDSGLLRGWRVPSSRARRIPSDALRRFLEDHGLLTDLLDEMEKQKEDSEA